MNVFTYCGIIQYVMEVHNSCAYPLISGYCYILVNTQFFYVTGASLNFFSTFTSFFLIFYFSPLFSPPSFFLPLTKYLLSSQYVSSILPDTMEYAISSKLTFFSSQSFRGFMSLEYIKAILPGDDFHLFL